MQSAILKQILSYRRFVPRNVVGRKKLEKKMKLDIADVEKFLQKNQHDGKVSVLKMNVNQACPNTTSYVSTVHRVLVNTRKIIQNHVDADVHLVVKETFENEEKNKKFKTHILFRNETLAYREIIPMLATFTPDHKLNVPHCYVADRKSIAVEDLTYRHFELINKFDGLTVELVKHILRALAKLHAASLVAQQEDPLKVDELASEINDVLYEKNGLQTSQGVNVELAIYHYMRKEKTTENTKIINKLKHLEANYARRQYDLVNSERRVKVFNHGDTSINNILIRGYEVMFIDLQIMRFTSVAADLNYFLYLNLKPSLRQEHLETFYAVYLKALNENVDAAGASMRDVLTEDWLKTEMNDYAVIGFLGALWTLPTKFLTVSEIKQLDHQRTAEQIWEDYPHALKLRLEELVEDYYAHNNF